MGSRLDVLIWEVVDASTCYAGLNIRSLCPASICLRIFISLSLGVYNIYTESHDNNKYISTGIKLK